MDLNQLYDQTLAEDAANWRSTGIMLYLGKLL